MQVFLLNRVSLQIPKLVGECAVGDEVVLVGRSAAGEPTAQDWAEAAGTINYEIVTRMGPRLPRVHIGH